MAPLLICVVVELQTSPPHVASGALKKTRAAKISFKNWGGLFEILVCLWLAVGARIPKQVWNSNGRGLFSFPMVDKMVAILFCFRMVRTIENKLLAIEKLSCL